MTPIEFLQVILMAAAWGGSFLFLRMAVGEFGAIALIGMRVTIAGLVLLPGIVGNRVWRQQFRDNAFRLMVLGVINAALPFTLFAYVTLFVTAGFASIINATAPLFTAFLAWLWFRERPGLLGVIGLVTGFSGVVLLVGGVPTAQSGTVLAIAGAFLASFLYGVSANYVKTRLAGVHAWVITGGSLVFATLWLLPLAVWQMPDRVPSTQAWVAVLLLAVLCTSIPNIYYFRLVVRAGPTRAMAVAFLIPVFGMLWGALMLGEVVTLTMLAACSVILLGTALVGGLTSRRLR
ncbi:MAG: DMT family transporter [Gammaproteobacteria bacterium]|nr:DMT family transporter [Gammaproteobacteria bacterium]